MSCLLIQPSPFLPAPECAWRELLSQAELQQQRYGGRGTGLKVLCAVLDVRDCTQDMGGKELKGGSQALSIFSTLIKELQNGLSTISGAIFDIILRSGIRSDILLVGEPRPAEGGWVSWLV